MSNYVHLRTHSAYSLSEGAVHLKQILDLAVREAMPSVALTDTNNLFGALEFSTEAAVAGIQPILGSVLTVRAMIDGDLSVEAPVTVLVRDSQGWDNLRLLINDAYRNAIEGTGPDGRGKARGPHVALRDLVRRSEGLFLLTGGPDGVIGRTLSLDQQNGMDRAARVLRSLHEYLPGRLAVELIRHEWADPERQQSWDRLDRTMTDLAYGIGIPVVATNDVMFADRDMHSAHDVLLCISEGTVRVAADRRRASPDQYFKSAEEMATLFADVPEAIANTMEIAGRCSHVLSKSAPMLPAFETTSGRGEVEELSAQAHSGLDDRLARHVLPMAHDAADADRLSRQYRDRLEYELGVIEQMGFPGYFLIVSDFIKWAKSNAIPVGPGRGSGAGSVVAWALSITDLDPIRWGLLFERFLNPERVSMPDFDVDFCETHRDRVIDYVVRTYGAERVAKIITFGKLRARAAIQNAGRVLQIPFSQVNRLSSMIPDSPNSPVTLADAEELDDRIRQAQQDDPQVAELFDVARRIEGLFRNASTHAAGVVISPGPLQDIVPLYRDPRSSLPVTQYNMKWVEAAGLVKFDFLGLATLTLIRKTVEIIQTTGASLDVDELPLDDPATFEMLSEGRTTGVFQLESSGMRDVLRSMKPERFEDLIAVVALYRPGPMDNIPTYVARKNDPDARFDCMHPKLEPILSETYGIMIYQEQVMQAAQALAGYSLGGADLLRRAMGKKIKAEMDAQRATFVAGAVANGVAESQASTIFDQIAAFAGYGFNKSHAAAYALIAYQTAYLKAHHPHAFLAACATMDAGDSAKLAAFIREMKADDIRILAPDINRSVVDFSLEPFADSRDGLAVRTGFCALKGVGRDAMSRLVAVRGQGFRTPFELVEKMAGADIPQKKVIEVLARSGALDHVGAGSTVRIVDGRTELTRAEWLNPRNIDILSRYSSKAQRDRQSGQGSLFGLDAPGAAVERYPTLVSTREMPAADRLRGEIEVLGFYASGHPIEAERHIIDNLPRSGGAAVRTIGDAIALASRCGEVRFRCAVMIHDAGGQIAKSGKPYVRMAVSDPTGEATALWFNGRLDAELERMLKSGDPMLVDAVVKSGGSDATLFLNDVTPLAAAAFRASPEAAPETARAGM